MNAKSNKKQYYWKVLVALFLAAWFVSASGTTITTFASSLDTTSPNDLVRQEMLKIAYLYAHHRWTATETNLLHFDITQPYPYGYPSDRFTHTNPFDPDNDPGNILFKTNILLEPDGITQKQVYNFGTGANGTLDRGTMDNPVDTPHWIVAGVENEGVPYAWGLSSGLVATQHDKDIAIDPPMQDVFIPRSQGR